MDPGKRTFYLGRYNCIEQLGTGPIGETYRAKIYGVAGFEKQFAVKRLYPHLSDDEAFVGRFVTAASAFAALEHHGIARVHEVNAQGAHYYIVVDLVRGLDLRRLLDLLQQRGEALSADAAMTVAVDVAEALEYAHAQDQPPSGGRSPPGTDGAVGHGDVRGRRQAGRRRAAGRADTARLERRRRAGGDLGLSGARRVAR